MDKYQVLRATSKDMHTLTYTVTVVVIVFLLVLVILERGIGVTERRDYIRRHECPRPIVVVVFVVMFWLVLFLLSLLMLVMGE